MDHPLRCKIDKIDFHLKKWLEAKEPGNSIGTVHSMFNHVINFISNDGLTLFSLAVKDVIQSPKMMKICDEEHFSYIKFISNPSKEIYLMSYEVLKIGSCLLDYSEAMVWEGELKSSSPTSPLINMERLAKLNDFIYTNGTDGGILTAWKNYLYPNLEVPADCQNIYYSCFLANLRYLDQEVKKRRIMEPAFKMAGLGIGLTPSGDDFLTGLFATWKYFEFPFYSEVERKKAVWLQKIQRRTTVIGYFMLENCLNGYINEALLELLENLDKEPTDPLKQILRIGSTSGTDMLAGVSFAYQQLIYQQGRQNNGVKSNY